MSPPDDNNTPIQPVRIPPWLWVAFGKAVGNRRRAAVIREFMRWYIRDPGAKLPKRPDPSEEPQ